MKSYFVLARRYARLTLIVNPSNLTNFTEQQRQVIESAGKGMAVLAGAGCGKTTTLVAKCEALILKNPKARFAAVSFTEKSAQDLKEKLSQKGLLKGPQGEWAKNWVTTIHGLCSHIIRENALFLDLEGDEGILSESDSIRMWEQLLDRLWTSDLPKNINESLLFLMDFENKDQIEKMIKRVKALKLFGVDIHLIKSEEGQNLKTVSDYLIELYESEKTKERVLDFDDLETLALKALNEKNIAEKYKSRFDLILVDEFQDTNPIQAQIINHIIKNDRSNLCVVGDPKQSIYRFRDADVNVFNAFCKELNLTLYLTYNFRSHPKLIDFINRLCIPLFEASQMEYTPLIPGLSSENSDQVGKVIKLSLDEPDQLADFIISEIKQGASLSQFTVLLRKIKGQEKWLKALRDKLPFAIESGGLFWKDSRTIELVAFLSFWENPKNRLSGMIFLRAPWLKISDVQLDEYASSEDSILHLFLQSDHPVALALKKYVNTFPTPGELLFALMVNEEIESEIGNAVIRLWNISEESLINGLDFHHTVRDFKSAVERSKKEKAIPPPQKEGALRVCTIHAAKGLEFENVVIVDFEKPWRAPVSEPFYWDKEEGVHLPLRDESGTRIEKKGTIQFELKAKEKFANLCESKRLFYVALTRAKSNLFFVCLKREPIKEGLNPFELDDWGAWLETLQIETLEGLEFEKGATLKQDKKSILVHNRKKFDLSHQRLRQSVTEWLLLDQCPRAYEWKIIKQKIPDQILQFNEEEKIEEFGIDAHALLENYSEAQFELLKNKYQDDEFDFDVFQRWIENSDIMKSSEESEDRFVYSEVSFEVPLPMGENQKSPSLLIGTMDRVIVGQGESSVELVDFKFTRQQEVSDSTLSRYELQIQLYFYALLRLDPDLKKLKHFKASLVFVQPKEVNVKEVSLPSWIFEDDAFSQNQSPIRKLSSLSHQIVNGHYGEPRASNACRHCLFLNQCAEGRKFLE